MAAPAQHVFVQSHALDRFREHFYEDRCSVAVQKIIAAVRCSRYITHQEGNREVYQSHLEDGTPFILIIVREEGTWFVITVMPMHYWDRNQAARKSRGYASHLIPKSRRQRKHRHRPPGKSRRRWREEVWK